MLKKLKPQYNILRWFLKYNSLKFFDQRYKDFSRYFRASNESLDYLQEKLRETLRLNPTWGTGHFYLAILSYRNFEVSKDPHFKGVIRISGQALKDLNFSKSHRDLIQAVYCFVTKDYSSVLEILTKLNFSEFSQSDPLNIIGSEIIASSLLILGDNESAFQFLKNIEESYQSPEIVEMLRYLEINK